METHNGFLSDPLTSGGLWLGAELAAWGASRGKWNPSASSLTKVITLESKMLRPPKTQFANPYPVGKWNYDGAHSPITWGTRPTKLSGVDKLVRGKYEGNVRNFLESVTLEEISPRAARRLDRVLAKSRFGKFGFGRASLRARALDRAMRSASPALANRMHTFRAARSVIGGLNWYFASEMASAAVKAAAGAAANWRPSYPVNKRRQLETGAMPIDTREAYTQRQRAIMAIHNSQMTTMAVLGNEAAMLHG